MKCYTDSFLFFKISGMHSGLCWNDGCVGKKGIMVLLWRPKVCLFFSSSLITNGSLHLYIPCSYLNWDGRKQVPCCVPLFGIKLTSIYVMTSTVVDDQHCCWWSRICHEHHQHSRYTPCHVYVMTSTVFWCYCTSDVCYMKCQSVAPLWLARNLLCQSIAGSYFIPILLAQSSINHKIYLIQARSRQRKSIAIFARQSSCL